MDNILLILRHTKKQLSEDMKYSGIIRAFSNLGWRVWYTYSDDGRIYISNGSTDIKIGRFSKKTGLISRNTSLYRAVESFIKSNSISFKYCYIRMVPATHGYYKMLMSIKNIGCKVAVEIPTYPFDAERNSEKFYIRALKKFMNRYTKKSAFLTDLFLPMGDKTDEVYGRPAVNIENGIDVGLLKLRHKNQTQEEIHILALAKVARWHGYDRIIEGMRIYYQKKAGTKVYLHIVGPDGDGTLKKYKQMVKDYGLSEYVFFEGPKFGADADPYFDMADIAAATLNKQGMSKVYSLKIGEYLARGIPFIYAEPEGHVDKTWDFCMELPSDGTPADIDKIAEFCKKVNDMPNLPQKMREIAQKEFSWEAQLEKMIDFFEKR